MTFVSKIIDYRQRGHCHCRKGTARCRSCCFGLKFAGGAEIASIGKRKYGKYKYITVHYERMENASTDYAQVRLRRGGKRKY